MKRKRLHFAVTSAALVALVVSGCADRAATQGEGSGDDPVGQATSALTTGSACVLGQVCQSAEATATIQRGGGVGNVFDSGINDNGVSSNAGSGTSGTIPIGDSGGPATPRQEVMNFDLTPITNLGGAGYTIDGAQVSLDICPGSTGQTINVHQATQSWGATTAQFSTYETTVSWPTFNESFVATPVTSFGAGAANAFPGCIGTGHSPNNARFDISSLVSGWVNGTIPEDGILMEQPPVAGTSTVVFSSDYPPALSGYHPTLFVEFNVTCATDTADCNNNGLDGCEANLGDDPNNCGACGNACGTGQVCEGGACVAACESLALNGSTYATAANPSTLNTPSVTLSAWFDFASGSPQYIAQKKEVLDAGYISYGIDVGVEGSGLDARFLTSAGFLDLNDAAFVPDGKWHQAAATYDAATGIGVLYLDGQQVATGTLGTGLYVSDPTQPFAIGADVYQSALEFAQGDIADVLVYGTALSGAQVAGLFQGAYAPGPLAWFPLAEGTGTSSADVSGNGHTLTVPGNWAATGPFCARFASTCLAIKQASPGATDGNYTLYVGGNASEPWTAYCHDMAGTPEEYLTLVNTTNANFSQYTAGGSSPGTSVRTSYTKVRINPTTLLVTTSDETFATSTGSLEHGGVTLVTSMPYAIAEDCDAAGSATGVANVDLTGTSFVVAPNQFALHGDVPGGVTTYSANSATVNLTGGGTCGSNSTPGTIWPGGPANPLQLVYMLCAAGTANCGAGASGCQTVLATNPNNCGACGNVCGAGQVCQGGACGFASTCLAIEQSTPGATDGNYTLYVGGNAGEPWTAYCHDMAGTPEEYLTLVNTTNANFSQYTAGGSSPGTSVRTSYTKVRINPTTFLVTTSDETFATSTGSLEHGGVTLVTSMPYAIAEDCDAAGSATGVANVDLTGTPFVVAPNQFALSGDVPGGVTTYSANDATVNLTGGGTCGWDSTSGTIWPGGPANPLRLVFTACAAGTANCGAGATGCQTVLATDPNNCGACGDVCGAGATCEVGVCITKYAVASTPNMIAFDGTNMWFTSTVAGTVTKLSPAGAALGTFAVGTHPEGIAFDGTNMWVANNGSNSVTELSPTGATLGTFATAASPNAIAFDGAKNVWVAGGDNVTELSPAGATLGTFYEGNDVVLVGIAFDGTNMWVTGNFSNSVTELSPTGATLGTFAVGSEPYGIAFDGTNMWVADSVSDAVTELSPTGATLGTFAVGSAADEIAFDGTNMWVTNSGSQTVTELSPTGATLDTFFVGPAPQGIAFDGAHMWVASANAVTKL